MCLCRRGAPDYNQGGMHVKLSSSEGPLLAATPLEGTASVWLHTERSLLGDAFATDTGEEDLQEQSEGVKYSPHF